MTQQQLINLGFAKKVIDNHFWYEFNYKNHKFITNDNKIIKGKDIFFIGYANSKNDDEFWFNMKLQSVEYFLTTFRLLVGKTMLEVVYAKKKQKLRRKKAVKK